MKIIVTGANGQLGTDTVKELVRRRHEVIAADLPDFNVTDRIEVQQFIRNNKPDAVIHLAAFTAVDRAESDGFNCYAVNAKGTRNVAGACRALNIKMLYTSTDYVFGGDGENFYETDDKASPKNVYGRTKYEGEKFAAELCPKLFIVRISWVFGKNGNNFVKTMLRLSETQEKINVVADQIGSPTYTEDLAVLLADMIETEKYGTYHATNEGICSFAEFAEEIMKQAGRSTVINPIKTADYPAAAVRPLNSRLSKKSLDEAGFNRLPAWQDALGRFLGE